MHFVEKLRPLAEDLKNRIESTDPSKRSEADVDIPSMSFQCHPLDEQCLACQILRPS